MAPVPAAEVLPVVPPVIENNAAGNGGAASPPPSAGFKTSCSFALTTMAIVFGFFFA
jgi:hypothetical protein